MPRLRGDKMNNVIGFAALGIRRGFHSNWDEVNPIRIQFKSRIEIDKATSKFIHKQSKMRYTVAGNLKRGAKILPSLV
jgi:hypothetical protein